MKFLLLICSFILLSSCNGGAGGSGDLTSTVDGTGNSSNNTNSGGSSSLNPNGLGNAGTSIVSGNALSSLTYIEDVKKDSDYTYLISKSIYGSSKILHEVGSSYFYEQSFYQTDGFAELPMTNVMITTDITLGTKKGFVLSNNQLFTKVSGVYQAVPASGSFVNSNLSLISEEMRDGGFVVRNSSTNKDWLVYMNNSVVKTIQLTAQLTTPIFGKLHKFNHKYYIVQTSGSTRSLVSISETLGTVSTVVTDIYGIMGVHDTANQLMVVEKQMVRADDSFHGSVKHIKVVGTTGTIGYPAATQDTISFGYQGNKSFFYNGYLYVWVKESSLTYNVDGLQKISSNGSVSLMAQGQTLSDIYYGVTFDTTNNKMYILKDDSNGNAFKELDAYSTLDSCGYTITSNVGTHCSTLMTVVGALMPTSSYGTLTTISNENSLSNGDFYHPCYVSSKFKLCKYSAGADTVVDSHVSGNEYPTAVAQYGSGIIYGRVYNSGTYLNDVRFY